MDPKLKALLNKLHNYHWSPRIPECYVLPNGTGLGKLAHNSYGAFNIIWATHKLETAADHTAAIQAFVPLAQMMKQEIIGAPLEDWITIQSPSAFAAWYTKYRHIVNPAPRPIIEAALNAIRQFGPISR